MFRQQILKSLICLLLPQAYAQDDKIGEPIQEAALYEPAPASDSRRPRCLTGRPPPSGQIGGRMMAEIDDDEIIARLVYAETSAARCAEDNSKIAP